MEEWKSERRRTDYSRYVALPAAVGFQQSNGATVTCFVYQKAWLLLE